MNEPLEPSDESLDELLARADWPAMGPAAAERLRGAWRAAFDPPRPAWRPLAIAAAAAVVCAASAAWWVLRGDEEAQLVSGPADDLVRPVALLDRIPRGETRAPTPFERLVITSAARGSARAASTAPAFPVEPKPATDEQARLQSLLASRDPRQLNRFLELVLAQPTRDAALYALRAMPDPPIDALIAQLGNPHVERRFAAARALGEVCRPDVVERLWRMVARDVRRREALAALTQCREPRAGQYLAIARDDPSLEAQLRSVRQQMKQNF